MIVFPNAKINLGLHVLRKRADGFHDLETIFYPIPLRDILDVVITGDSEKGHSQIIGKNNQLFQPICVALKSGRLVYFSSSGIPIDGKADQNLCIKACELFDAESSLRGNVKIHLHKQIPLGAGLGGGSSDAAFVIKVLNQLSDTPVSDQRLLELAGKIGSDCPFFLVNKPVLAKGRGESMKPIKLNLSGYKIVIIKTAAHVSTREAFSAIQPFEEREGLIQLAAQLPGSWNNKMKNDFEPVIFSKYPEIENLKNQLIEKGAL